MFLIKQQTLPRVQENMFSLSTFNRCEHNSVGLNLLNGELCFFIYEETGRAVRACSRPAPQPGLLQRNPRGVGPLAVATVRTSTTALALCFLSLPV